MLLCGGPSGSKADDCVVVVVLFPEAESYLFLKLLHFGVFENDKLLICGGIHKEFIAFFAEHCLELLCHIYGVAAYFEIKVVCEQRVELNAVESALCQKSAVLFDHCKEVLGSVIVCEHHRLAAKRAYFSAADIENVA